MTRAHRLGLMLELADEQQQKAAKALASAGRRLEEAQARLEVLRRFRSEYALRLRQGGVGVNAMQLYELRIFFGNLERAVGEQEATVRQLRQEYAARMVAWRRAHCRQQGIGKIRAELLRREQAARERRLQRELDDRAAARRRKRPRD